MKYKLIKPINENYSTEQQILTNRGIRLEDIPHYLHTTDDDINPPTVLGEDLLKAAAATLIKTIQADAQALVIVDSDCDGFTSAAVLINYLHDLFPAWVENKLNYVLHSGKQHGLNDHIENILKCNYSLVIVPDAGSNDTIECTRLKEDCTSVIVLDHHICDVENPDAIVINNQLSNYPNKQFSGVGVVWQFCRYIDSLMNTNYADNYLDLVALGNDADMMSLTEFETKHLIQKGFENPTNPFFVHMAQKNAFSLKGKLNPISVAFYIAPYVNAITRSGTIEEKTITFQSMLKHKAFKIIPSTKRGHAPGETEQLVEQAMRVVTNVKNRQTKAQEAGLNTVQYMIEERHLLDHKVLLFLLEPGQIDRNIAGLIANKLMAKYQRPVCLLARIEEQIEQTYIPNDAPWDSPDPIIKKIKVISYQGSARGCDKAGVSDFKSICAATGVTMYQSGHPGAFGLGILADNIQSFIEKTDTALADMSNEAIYYVDYIYQGDNVDPNALLKITGMEDLYGKDIDEPLLCIEHLKVSSDMVTVYQKKDNTLKISLSNGVSLMKFKATDEECDKLQNIQGWNELNIVGRANRNEWMGNVSAQLFIQDYQIIDSSQYVF